LFAVSRRKSKGRNSSAAGNPTITDDGLIANQITNFDESQFVFDLFINDYIILHDNEGKSKLCRITSISKGDIEVRIHTDGRRQDVVKKSRDRIRVGGKIFARRGFRKVLLSPTGLLRDALTGEIIDEKEFLLI